MSPAMFRAKIKSVFRRHKMSEDLELVQKKIDTLRRKLTRLSKKPI